MPLFDTDSGGVSLPSIANSLRTNGANSFITHNYAPATTTYSKLTLSFWVKRSSLGTYQCIFGGGRVGTGYPGDYIRFNTSDQLEFVYDDSANGVGPYATTRVFRDTSAFYHIHIAFDTTLTGSDKCKLWVNNEPTTVSNGIGSILYFLYGGASGVAAFGSREGNSYAEQYFDGYFADVCIVTNLAKSPTDFAYTDHNGQWRTLGKAKLIEQVNLGGAQGSYTPFDNGTSTTTVGYDASAKGNNWTLTNMVRDGSVNDCWVTDTPTNNFATFNGADYNNVLATTRNGGLNLFNATNYSWTKRTNFGLSSGKWYVEFKVVTAFGYYPRIGITSIYENVVSLYGPGMSASSYGIDSYAGDKSNNSSYTAYGSAIVTGDVIGVALDMDAGKIWFSKNGTWFASGNPATGANPAFTGITGTMCFAASVYVSEVAFNAGQRPFVSTPPTGFKSVCSANLPVPTITNPKKHFDVKLHTGTGVSQNITGIPFKPDLVWTKARNIAYTAAIYDAVRGATKFIIPSLTDAEYTNVTALTAFNSDGFSVGTDNSNGVNSAGITYVDWLWKAGGTAVSNTAGTITSQVSANVEAGFSIVTYTGTGANATVGHGLNAAPKLVIVKGRSGPVVNPEWAVWHTALAGTEYLNLNRTNAKATLASQWNNTTPTSTVFSVGTNGDTNYSTEMLVAYCFAEIPGYSKISSYVGNGLADGPFVYCGFKPKYVLIKNATGSSSWIVHDTTRAFYNADDTLLYPNLAQGEDNPGSQPIDITSNGFKIRNLSVGSNSSGGTYIFYAVAEAPFQYANAR